MNYDPKSIADHIECLARLTGAPLSFVDQVRQLFTTKGISLDTAAQPFLTALEEAFRREESIRCSSFRAREKMHRMQENYQKVGEAYVEQISQLKRIQTNLHDQSRRLRKKLATQRSEATQITIKGDHRTLITKPEREEMAMVPGPKDPQ